MCDRRRANTVNKKIACILTRSEFLMDDMSLWLIPPSEVAQQAPSHTSYTVTSVFRQMLMIEIGVRDFIKTRDGTRHLIV